MKTKSQNSTIRNIINFLIVFALIVPNFAFAQSEPILPPETPEEAKEMGEKALEVSKEKLPGILEKIWKEEVLPVWQKIWTWTKNYWKDTLWPWIKGFWERRIKPPVEEEVEKRKEIIEERIEKEKEEFQEKVIPETTKSLWEKFKDLIK